MDTIVILSDSENEENVIEIHYDESVSVKSEVEENDTNQAVQTGEFSGKELKYDGRPSAATDFIGASIIVKNNVDEVTNQVVHTDDFRKEMEYGTLFRDIKSDFSDSNGDGESMRYGTMVGSGIDLSADLSLRYESECDLRVIQNAGETMISHLTTCAIHEGNARCGSETETNVTVLRDGEMVDTCPEIDFTGTSDLIGQSSRVGLDSVTQDGETILSILINNPKDFCLSEKPSAVRTDKMFTLNAKNIKIESMKADDNGPYVYKGTSSKLFYYDKNDGAFTVHAYDDVLFYYNKRSGSKYTKQFVVKGKIYELTRRYRQSKYNPGFSNTIATVRKLSTNITLDHYCVIYKWTGEVGIEFIVPRHGNARNPNVSPYYRQDASIHTEIDRMLDNQLSNEAIYCELSKENPKTVSETIRNQKVVSNRKFGKEKERERGDEERKNIVSTEAELIISYVKENDFVQSVCFTPSEYSTMNYQPQMIVDIERFCVKKGQIFSVDTTFQLCDGLWLTDTSYPNISLIKVEDGKHPEFPGPCFWHFRKDRKAFRRFAAELVVENPTLLQLPLIGHDLDKAQLLGFSDVFSSSSSVWCTQHIKERDAEKLRVSGANKKEISSILSDIYGTQNQILLQNGLADADDKEDFEIKLESLKEVWDFAVPGFHQWFVKYRANMFIECLTLSAREKLGIKERYYTNGLENKHKLQKKKIAEANIPSEVIAVSKQLKQWSNQYQLEAERALRGLGRYRLSEEYNHLEVSPVKWNQLSAEKQEDIKKKFNQYVPGGFAYRKPPSAGLKVGQSGKSKRRVRLPEPELFEDRVGLIPPPLTKVMNLDEGESSASNARGQVSDVNQHEA